MNEVSSKMVVDLAKIFIEFMQGTNANWQKGYYRFLVEEGHYGSNASYADDNEIFIIGALRYTDFYNDMTTKSLEFLEYLGKTKGLFLLIVDSDFNYDIKFEWNDLGRWSITKLDGGTGVPLGL